MPSLRSRVLFVVLAALGFAVAVGLGSITRSAHSAVTCSYYASTSGSDSAAGTQTAPFRTASKLVRSVHPGETGCFLGGTFSESLTISSGGTSDSSRITLTTAPGYATATLKGILYITPAAPYVTLSGLKLDGGVGSGVSVQLFGDYGRLDGNEITNNHSGESCVIVGEYEGSWAHVVNGVVINGNRIHDCGMASNGAHDHGIYLASSRDAKVTNNTIYDNGGGWGIQLWADAHRTEVAYNVIDGNASGNIIMAGGSYSSLGPSSNNSLHDNILTFPKGGYNVEPYWQGGKAGTNNSFTGNCVYGGASGNFSEVGNGYTQSGTILADPLYTNRSGKDFSLRSGSPCAGKGPQSSGTAAPATTTTTTTTTTTPPTTTTTTTTTTPPVTTTTTPSSPPPTTTTTTTPSAPPPTTTTTTTTTTTPSSPPPTTTTTTTTPTQPAPAPNQGQRSGKKSKKAPSPRRTTASTKQGSTGQAATSQGTAVLAATTAVSQLKAERCTAQVAKKLGTAVSQLTVLRRRATASSAAQSPTSTQSCFSYWELRKK